MQEIFTLNPSIAAIDLKDAIYCRINKTKAILTCVMFAAEFLRDDMEVDNHTLYNALWIADDCLNELGVLFQRLEELH